MEMTYFDSIPTSIKQTFSRVRRTSGGAQDTYGDATFSETTTIGFKGFFQYGQKAGETVSIAGKEISYDARVFTSATMLIGERDILVFGSSTSTSVSTRYAIQGILQVYESGVVDHKEIYASQEIVT